MEEKKRGGKGEEEMKEKEGEKGKTENKGEQTQQSVTLQCFDLLQSPPGQTPKNSYVSQLSVHQLSMHPSLRFLAPLPP